MVMVMEKVYFFRLFRMLRGRGLDVSGVAEPSLRVIWRGNMVDGLPRPAIDVVFAPLELKNSCQIAPVERETK